MASDNRLANIPGPANAWRGSAWEGYSNPEFDRLLAAFGVALDPADRNRIAADIVRLYTTELPAISLFFPVSSNVFSSDVSGHEVRPASSNPSWNIHKWELR